MKLLVDVSRAVADGILTPEQGEKLTRAAAADTMAFAINSVLTIGVLAVAGGVLALEPPMSVVIALGVLLAAAGQTLRFKSPVNWSFLGTACVLVGAFTLSGGVLVKWQGHVLAFLAVSIILLALGILARSGLLIAMTVFAVAGLLGSSTGYWHAAYALWVEEPSFTIVVFSAFALAGLWLSERVPRDYRGLATVFARLSVVWVNFGFWIGSLWGDYPLSSWLAPEAWEQRQPWREHWLHIPDGVFVALWAVALLGVGVWGARANRRFVVNTVATFGAIHFYTQWFERLEANPFTIILAGLIAVAAAVALWRYNQRRAAGPPAPPQPAL